jgi:hypothetical protein
MSLFYLIGSADISGGRAGEFGSGIACLLRPLPSITEHRLVSI